MVTLTASRALQEGLSALSQGDALLSIPNIKWVFLFLFVKKKASYFSMDFWPPCDALPYQ